MGSSVIIKALGFCNSVLFVHFIFCKLVISWILKLQQCNYQLLLFFHSKVSCWLPGELIYPFVNLISREMFNKWQAQRWWAENYDKVMELYNVQRFNRQAVPLPTPPRSEDEVSFFSACIFDLFVVLSMSWWSPISYFFNSILSIFKW